MFLEPLKLRLSDLIFLISHNLIALSTVTFPTAEYITWQHFFPPPIYLLIDHTESIWVTVHLRGWFYLFFKHQPKYHKRSQAIATTAAQDASGWWKLWAIFGPNISAWLKAIDRFLVALFPPSWLSGMWESFELYNCLKHKSQLKLLLINNNVSVIFVSGKILRRVA